MVGALLITNGVSVFASDITVSGNSIGSTPTSFIATEDMLCNEVIVSIPAEMVLTYDSATKKLSDSDVVIAKGDIKSGRHLEVSVPTNITYKHVASESITVNGVLNFGTNGVEEWTPSQVGSSAGDSRQISSVVDAHELDYTGTYKATIIYNISIVND